MNLIHYILTAIIIDNVTIIKSININYFSDLTFNRHLYQFNFQISFFNRINNTRYINNINRILIKTVLTIHNKNI